MKGIRPFLGNIFASGYSWWSSCGSSGLVVFNWRWRLIFLRWRANELCRSAPVSDLATPPHRVQSTGLNCLGRDTWLTCWLAFRSPGPRRRLRSIGMERTLGESGGSKSRAGRSFSVWWGCEGESTSSCGCASLCRSWVALEFFFSFCHWVLENAVVQSEVRYRGVDPSKVRQSRLVRVVSHLCPSGDCLCSLLTWKTRTWSLRMRKLWNPFWWRTKRSSTVLDWGFRRSVQESAKWKVRDCCRIVPLEKSRSSLNGCGSCTSLCGKWRCSDDVRARHYRWWWSCCQSFHGAVVLPLDITDGVARNARTWEHSRELRRLRLSELWTAPNLVLIAYHQRRQRCGVRIAGIFSVGGRSVTLSRFQKWWRFWDDLGPPCLRLKYGQGKGRSTLLFRRGLKVDSVGIKDLSLSAVMPHPPLESVRPSVMEFVPRNTRWVPRVDLVWPEFFFHTDETVYLTEMPRG